MQYYLNNGIVQDIVLARQSYDLLMTVGENAPKLGASVYTDFFQSLRGILSDSFVVHVTKLFERPNDRYETISIPTILKFISEHSKELKIVERPLVCQHLSCLGIEELNSFSYSSFELSKLIVEHFEFEVVTKENSPALQRLQILRNKRIAHREAIDISNSPSATFKESLDLVKFAQNFAIIAGAAYTSTIYGFVNEQFYLADDIKKNSISLKKYLRH